MKARIKETGEIVGEIRIKRKLGGIKGKFPLIIISYLWKVI